MKTCADVRNLVPVDVPCCDECHNPEAGGPFSKVRRTEIADSDLVVCCNVATFLAFHPLQDAHWSALTEEVQA